MQSLIQPVKALPQADSSDARSADLKTTPIAQLILGLSGVQIGAMVLNLLKSKVTALTVGPAGVGTISIIDQVATLVAQISTLSLPYASVKFLSAAHSEGDRPFARQYAAFVRILVWVSLTGCAIGITVVLKWPLLLGRDLVADAGLMVLALAAIPATNLMGLFTSAMAAARRVRAAALYGVCSSALLAALCGTAVVLAGVSGYYVANLVALVILAAGGGVYLYRFEHVSLSDRTVNIREEMRRYPKIASFAASLYVISFALPVAYLVARYSIVKQGGMEAAGLLQSAMGLGLALTAAMRPANALFLTPRLNRKGPRSEKLKEAVNYMGSLSLIIGVVALPIVLFPKWCLSILYSSKFVGSASSVYMFVLAQTLEIMAGVNLALLVGLDRIGAQVGITLIGLTGLATMSSLLVPRYGISGVGIAFITNGSLVFVISSCWLWIREGVAPQRSLSIVPLGVIGAIATAGVLSSQADNSWLIVIAKATVWIAFTAIAVYVLSRERLKVSYGDS